MCGISAIIASDYLDSLQSMTDLIRHRGPDDEGYVAFSSANAYQTFSGQDTPPQVLQEEGFYFPKERIESGTRFVNSALVGLGHRRLSILDLSSMGHQPMCTADQRYWVVYNGEIYNYQELRQELEKLGAKFLSYTDTEVLLYAYQYWGKACLHRFNGMFAFVLYDMQKRTIFAVRDRFGIKPLYYWQPPEGGVVFASEIKQFTVFPGWSPKLEHQNAYDFLTWRVINHTQETLIQGVYEVPAGHFCELEVDSFSDVKTQSWYTLQSVSFQGDYNSAKEEFLSLFQDAVRLRLRADVPVGSCLSGGLDSSSIVCSVNHILEQQNGTHLQKTFSACSHEEAFDERKYIEHVVQATQVAPHYIYPSHDNMFDLMENLIWYQDQPITTMSIYAQWLVFEAAKKNQVDVMLDGQGADEYITGYQDYFGPYLLGLLYKGQIKSFYQTIRNLKSHHYSMLHILQLMANHSLPEWLKQFMRKKAGKVFANPDWINFKTLKSIPRDPAISLQAKTRSITQYSQSLIQGYTLPALLHWEDRSSMSHSVESRVPFLDYRLVEFVLGLPEEYRLHLGDTKRILRDSMKGVLPEVVRARKDKMGFVFPESVWFYQHQKQFKKAFQQALEKSNGIFSEQAQRKYDRILNREEPFSFFPLKVIFFGSWMDRFQIKVA